MHSFFNIISLSLIGTLIIACQPRKMTDEFFGLRLNEQYNQIEAVGILAKNTGKTFELEESFHRIVGNNITFAGYPWEKVFFDFDYINHLKRVIFYHQYYSFGQRVDTPSFRQAEDEAEGRFYVLALLLEEKYGKPDIDYNRMFHKGWKIGKTHSILMTLTSAPFRGYNESGLFPHYAISLFYSDSRANASATDDL